MKCLRQSPLARTVCLHFSTLQVGPSGAAFAAAAFGAVFLGAAFFFSSAIDGSLGKKRPEDGAPGSGSQGRARTREELTRFAQRLAARGQRTPEPRAYWAWFWLKDPAEAALLPSM